MRKIYKGGSNMPEATSGLIYTFGPMIVMLGLLYFLIIKPQQKRQREVMSMREGIQLGDSITTIGGLIGKVVKMEDEKITIETSTDFNKIEILRRAISYKNTEDEAVVNEE